MYINLILINAFLYLVASTIRCLKPTTDVIKAQKTQGLEFQGQLPTGSFFYPINQNSQIRGSKAHSP
ncbi:hypothetical protein L596_022151 [Steinernema carpocapsae]|uniref:Uncharacterized protein n=1 Tax=Steinernema carpocapsae TaxID=34508 RepID=A0A4U5MLQ3_STECR|nr:hypothetical protein L596_022151 [Steinernema carpocapsae]